MSIEDNEDEEPAMIGCGRVIDPFRIVRPGIPVWRDLTWDLGGQSFSTYENFQDAGHKPRGPKLC